MNEVVKITARKWNGDDEYSWAVFSSRQSQPIVTGLSKFEVNGQKRTIRKLYEEKGYEVKCSV